MRRLVHHSRSAAPLGVGSRFRESGGEVEAAEGVWGEEGGDFLDVRAAQGEHVDGARQEGLRLAVPGVEAEGELPVGASGDETPARDRKSTRLNSSHSQISYA